MVLQNLVLFRVVPGGAPDSKWTGHRQRTFENTFLSRTSGHEDTYQAEAPHDLTGFHHALICFEGCAMLPIFPT